MLVIDINSYDRVKVLKEQRLSDCARDLQQTKLRIAAGRDQAFRWTASFATRLDGCDAEGERRVKVGTWEEKKRELF